MAMLGMLVFLAGIAGSVGCYIFNLEFLLKLPIPPVAWLGATAAGFVFYMFTRRASD